MSRAPLLAAIALVTAGAAGACGGATHPPPAAAAAPPSCDAVSEPFNPHVRDHAPADAELYEQADDTIRAVAVQSCRDDHWPDALIRCYADGHDEVAWKQCDAMLTPAERDGFSAHLFAAMWQQ
jgi:hypothetical protein